MNNLISIHSVPRSGSSWLLSIFDSCINTKCLYQPLFSYKFKNYLNNDSTKDNFNYFINNLKETDDEFCTMKSDYHTNSNKNNILTFDKKKIDTIIMKHVTHHYLINKFIEWNNNIKIIGLIRDPKQVINSQMNAKHEKLKDWLYGKDKNKDLKENYFGFNKWIEVNEYFLNLKKEYPKNVYLINYDDLLKNTNEEIKKLFEFCDLKIDQITLDFIKKSTSTNNNYDYSVFRNKDQLIDRKCNLDKNIVDYIEKELQSKSDKNNKMRVGIYVRIRDENNIIEWMKYHYKCGFDYILFYDDYSEPSVKSIIENYGKFDNKKYKVLEKLFPKNGTVKGSPLNNNNNFLKFILPIIKKEMDYVFYIDMDEYLFMNNYKNIKNLIKSYENFDVLFIRMVYFGNNNHIECDTSNLLKNFTRSSRKLHRQGKSLAKVSSIKGIKNAHWFLLNKPKNDHVIINQSNKKILEFADKHNLDFKFKENKIYLAHYAIQDIKTFLNRRLYNIDRNLLIRTFFLNLNHALQIKKEYNINQILNIVKKNKNKKLKDIKESPIPFLFKKPFYDRNLNDVKNLDLLNFYNK